MPFPVRLSDHLRCRERVVLHATDAVPCAVLLPLVPAGADFDLVYTLRTDHLPSHKGQVAFPGGKRAADEALVDTALDYEKWTNRRHKGEWDEKDPVSKATSAAGDIVSGIFGSVLARRMREPVTCTSSSSSSAASAAQAVSTA